jgi:hypothetical protein
MKRDSELDPEWRPETYWVVDAPEEVEIASLYLASGLGNTITLFARPDAGGISIRAEDEYDGTLSVVPTHVSVPLTNAELMAAAKSLEWTAGIARGSVWSVRDAEADVDLEVAVRFISGESELYPAFESLVEEDNREWADATQRQWDLERMRRAVEELRRIVLEGHRAPRYGETVIISTRELQHETIDSRLRELFEAPEQSAADELVGALASEFPFQVGIWAVLTGRTALARALLSRVAASEDEEREEAQEGLALLELIDGDEQQAHALWEEL